MNDAGCAIEVWHVVGLATRGGRGGQVVGGFGIVVEASSDDDATGAALAWLKARRLRAVDGTLEAHRCRDGERTLAKWSRDVLAAAKAGA